MLDNSFSFIIPVYEKMPTSLSEMPSDNKIIENNSIKKRRCKWRWTNKSIGLCYSKKLHYESKK